MKAYHWLIILSVIAINSIYQSPEAICADFYPDTVEAIQTALTDAENNEEDDVIYIQPHHYALTEVLEYSPDDHRARNSLTIQGVAGASGVPRLDGMSQTGILLINTYYSYNDYGAEIIVRDLIFQNASEWNLGSGMKIHTYQASFTVHNCCFYNNECNFDGGAIHAVACSYLTITNCIFDGNSAQGNGSDSTSGGVYIRLYDDVCNIMNNTFINNTADSIADQAFISIGDGTLNIYNNIFWPGDIRISHQSGTFVNLQHNVYEILEMIGLGTVNQFDNFIENPNLDERYAPESSSICIDNGDSFHGIPSTDYYGNARPNPDTAIVDIGAVEYYSSGPPSSPTPIPSPTATPPSGLGVELTMPGWVSPGNHFWISGIIYNDGRPIIDVPVVFVLDVLGSYWFWPCWEPPGTGTTPFCHEIRDIPTGNTSIDVLPIFEWPDTGADTASGLFIYGALLQSDYSDIRGNWDACEFGYGPH